LLTTYNPYPVAPPGTSPWADKSGYSGAAFVAVFGLMFLGWIPVAPGAVIFFMGQHIIGMMIAVLIPAALYAGAIALVNKTVANRMPRVYEKAGVWVNYNGGSPSSTSSSMRTSSVRSSSVISSTSAIIWAKTRALRRRARLAWATVCTHRALPADIGPLAVEHSHVPSWKSQKISRENGSMM